MWWLAELITIITLCIMAWQDFRSRQIAWWTLPPLAGGIFFSGLQQATLAEIEHSFFQNIVFLILQMLLVWAWISLRRRKIINIIDIHIGMGDLLVMCCLALAFSTANFLVFYTCVLVLALAGALVSRFFSQNKETQQLIPLAGIVAVPLLILYVWRIIDPAKNLFDDEWLLRITGNNF